MKHTSRLIAFLTTLLIATVMVVSVSAQTSETVTTAIESDTLTPAQEAAAFDTEASTDEATQTIVLLGEKVSVENPDSKKGPFTDIEALTTATLGGKVTDMTTHGLTIAGMKASVTKAVKAKPNIAIIFTGYSDEHESASGKPESSSENQRKYLGAIVSALSKVGTRVFLVPASTVMGASSNANLRLVATDHNVTFVPMGTEVSGQPFEEAFAGIKAELANPQQAEAAVPVPSKAVLISGRTIQDPNAVPAEPVDYEAKKASLQKELDRIAGAAGDDIGPPQKNIITTGTNILSADSFTTTSAYPPGGTMTKRGAEAQENINMRPLPAVKAFRPSIPVPRNRLDVKEPDISR